MIATLKRHSERLKKEFRAQLTILGKVYGTTIENVSESGLKVSLKDSNSDVMFLSGRRVELQFEPEPGETVSLSCRIVWSRKKKLSSFFRDIGLEISEKSQIYEDWFKSLTVCPMVMLYENGD